MKLVLSYLLLFAVGCYSILSFQPEVKASSQEIVKEISKTQYQATTSCCKTQEKIEPTDKSCSNDENNDSCENPCCEDFCFCVKHIKNIFLEVVIETNFTTHQKNKYGEITNATPQLFTPSIFTPPKHIA